MLNLVLHKITTGPVRFIIC